MNHGEIRIQRVANGFVIHGYGPQSRLAVLSTETQVAIEPSDLAKQIEEWAAKNEETTIEGSGET